tara:strand:- start:4134 stop:5612 length:1479 start_codon:yes stop_codon:yes gene_type:complete
MKNKKITIIGGGLSGLSASCYLAKEGFQVTIVEKNESIGGRLSSFRQDGFTFDMGPSWYWMPDVFESFFSDFGKNIEDYYELVRLNPSYKFFMENNEINISKDIDKIYSLFDDIEPGSSKQLKLFLEQAKMKYDVSMEHFIDLPNMKVSEYLSSSILKHSLSLDLFKSLRKHISKYFSSKILREILEFPSMFLGGSPNNTPALYSLMNYADIINGTWYPMGGMIKIADAFKNLSSELGVNHIINDEIDHFSIDNNAISSILSKKDNLYKSDLYIACSEYPHTQTELIDKNNRSYDKRYWSKKNIAPSALIFYLGTSKKIDKLEHHNLFFDKDFDQHLNEIFDKEVWPTEPLFYVCCPSKTDKTVVPKDSYENLFILVPIGSNSVDNEDVREKYFNQIMNRLEEKTGQNIRDSIITKKSFCVNDFTSRYNSYKGNAYGLANTLLQTALFKPKIKDKIIKNLYYTGQFTVPGPGLPPAIISGKIVANEIIKGKS